MNLSFFSRNFEISIMAEKNFMLLSGGLSPLWKLPKKKKSLSFIQLTPLLTGYVNTYYSIYFDENENPIDQNEKWSEFSF